MEINEQFAKKFFSDRIGGKYFGDSKQVYKFEKIKRAKKEALAKYPNRALIDMGVGEPDDMASSATVDYLCREAQKYENRGYADNGCDEFKEAAARYMLAQFGVGLNSKTEIMHSMGSKSALSILPLCFVNPADVVMMTAPGYPIFGTHSKYLLADVVTLPLKASNNYLPDFDEVPEFLFAKTKVIVVNYPNNPTGACATKEFFKKLIDLAHKYSFLVINDAAYAELMFDKKDKLSILSIDGAKEVALELHSMSKGFNMTGWRIGWICGNEKLINAYGYVKDNMNSGQFLAIQKAAAHSLNNNVFIAENNARKYAKRMEAIVPILKNSGFNIDYVKAGFFLYTQIPHSAKYRDKVFDFANAEEFAEWMIAELGIVVVPWDDIEPSVRFSLTFGSKDVSDDEIIGLFRDRMSNVAFRFLLKK